MNRVFVTGDCHGDYTRFSTKTFPEQKELTRDDYVIVAGDFGYWDNSPEQRYWRKWLNGKPWTTLFVDGNHENFDMLNTLPVEMWHGGKVHRVADNIIHLMRGQIFDIGGKKWFTFGGAPSHDIQDGILDPNDPDFAEKLRHFHKIGAMFRIKNISWWPEEIPNKEEKAEAIRNLAAAGNKVDYIVTHEAPWEMFYSLSRGRYDPNPVCDWLQVNLLDKIEFQRWFCGHHHREYQFRNITMHYFKIEEISN